MKQFLLFSFITFLLASCVNKKSEEQIRAEVELEYVEKELAEAKQKLAESEGASSASSESESREAVSPSSVAPLHKNRSGGGDGDAAYGTDFDWLSLRYATADDLSGLDGSWLRILRNSIYARHGYIFKSADLRQYFGQFAWYNPRYSNVESQLSSVERANVKEIKRWE